jgi:hypothetical protein
VASAYFVAPRSYESFHTAAIRKGVGQQFWLSAVLSGIAA